MVRSVSAVENTLTNEPWHYETLRYRGVNCCGCFFLLSCFPPIQEESSVGFSKTYHWTFFSFQRIVSVRVCLFACVLRFCMFTPWVVTDCSHISVGKQSFLPKTFHRNVFISKVVFCCFCFVGFHFANTRHEFMVHDTRLCFQCSFSKVKRKKYQPPCDKSWQQQKLTYTDERRTRFPPTLFRSRWCDTVRVRVPNPTTRKRSTENGLNWL